MNREEALALLKEFTTKDGLIKHAYAVEACMRAYAKKFGEDEEEWGIVGLLHDFDYEKYPDLKDHPFKGAEILRERGVKEEWIRTILSHADYSGIKRDNLITKTLFACDELTGFIVAVALVHPSKKLSEVKVKSVKKKLKDKAFAAKVNRDDIVQGAEKLDIPLDDHISFMIDAMQESSNRLGL
ncbi:MAG: HDIG domain-containing protein [Spirochaetota bacterium]|nr:MAG: HDIG domain-containing protein [Spirochaetota bacterium]